MRKEVLDFIDYAKHNINVYFTRQIYSKDTAELENIRKINKKKNDVELQICINYLEQHDIILTDEEIAYIIKEDSPISRLILYIFVANHEYIINNGVEGLRYSNYVKRFLSAYYKMYEIKRSSTKEKDLGICDNIGFILENFKNYHCFSREEEIRVFKEYSLNPSFEIRNYIVCCNLRLVFSVIKNFKYLTLDFSDMFQAGTEGLIRAVKKYDVSRNIKFSTYAYDWIYRKIFQFYYKNSRVVRLPVHIFEKQLKYKNAVISLTNRLHREPTIEEIMEESGLSRKYVLNFKMKYYDIGSLDIIIGFEEDSSLIDFVQIYMDSVDNTMYEKELLMKLKESMRILSDRERTIISLRNGLDGEDNLTLQAIGDKMGLSRERVRQIERRALYKLFNELDDN